MKKYLKRYLRFSYSRYYPEGGMKDFVKDFESLDELFQEKNNIFATDLNSIESIYDCEKGLEIFRTYENKAYFPLEDNEKGYVFAQKDGIIEELCRNY